MSIRRRKENKKGNERECRKSVGGMGMGSGIRMEMDMALGCERGWERGWGTEIEMRMRLG